MTINTPACFKSNKGNDIMMKSLLNVYELNTFWNHIKRKCIITFLIINIIRGDLIINFKIAFYRGYGSRKIINHEK